VWDVKSRDKTMPDDLEKEIDEQPNDHNQLVFNKKQTPAVISNRDFLGRAVWKKEGGGFVVVAFPEESTKRPANKKSGAKEDFAVRGKYPSIMRISPIIAGETKLEYVIHPVFGGGVPPAIFNRYLGVNLSEVTAIQEFFEEQRGMDEYDKADGRALGYRRECTPPPPPRLPAPPPPPPPNSPSALASRARSHVPGREEQEDAERGRGPHCQAAQGPLPTLPRGPVDRRVPGGGLAG
jgi:hypothetical protein